MINTGRIDPVRLGFKIQISFLFYLLLFFLNHTFNIGKLTPTFRRYNLGAIVRDRILELYLGSLNISEVSGSSNIFQDPDYYH